MNVFLMYPNQDFNPEQPLLSNQADLMEDLELQSMIEAMSQGDTFLFNVSKQVVLSSLHDINVIRYRQEILQDCLKHPGLVREIYDIALESKENKRKRWMGIYSRYPSGILSSAVEMLEMFVRLLHKLKRIADQHAKKVESRGFTRFFAMLQQELDDEYFASVQEHLKSLKFKHGIMISASLGMGNEGTNYVLRKSLGDHRNWLVRMINSQFGANYTYRIHPRDDHGARALGELRDRGLNLIANAVAQSADHIDNFLNNLKNELAFYLGCINLSNELSHLQMPISIPIPFPQGQRSHSFSGLYDASLALILKNKIVGNDANAVSKDLILITGANQGGKSTFLRSIGLAQLMMQSGLFVPAVSFSANLFSRLFTHFKREEDVTMTSGKFDEELSRMSSIINELKPDSMILFNESFAATNEREGSEIARQIIDALLEKRMKIFFVTHLYELASSYHDRRVQSSLFLLAERKTGGDRTFKLIEGKPLPTSFGQDVYNKIFAQ